jgi:hypothetical protein
LLLGFLGVAVFLSAGCSRKEKRSRKSEVDPKVVAAAKPDFTLTSKEFSEEKENNREAFREKFDEKIVELTGVVKEINRGDKDAWLYLEGAAGELRGVVCTMVEKEPWLKALPGQTVKLKGITPENPGDVVLDACSILDVSGPAPPSFTVDELKKAFSAERQTVLDKFEKKYLFLRGTVARVSLNRAGAARVVLLTTGRPEVCCVFNASFKEQTESLKAGDKIKVLGRYMPVGAEEDIELSDCIRLEDRK